ncbi:ATP-dependent 6-phosphofructokinase [Candidatus Shikimatogenerans bostrichidophilus]|uniref:ATP-dependent 6-phosphofructokinase n=1 Tax=Candidatus Shikimatogenerans bostrichidophilus TaxID=2943807 RepID=UPI0029674C4D
MLNKINNIGIITSGGDSPGMNAAIKSIVNYSINNNINCYGIKYGYDGLINGNIKKLSNKSVYNIIGQGGSILGTGRSIKFKTILGRKKAFENIKKNNLDALIIIGGNGTFTGAIKFNKEYNFPIIGIPGTIDNDINGTDITIGYDTSLNTIIQIIEKIKDTAITNNRIFIIEVMGKGLGFLAFNSGISIGALDILIPNNNKYDLKNLYKILNKWNKYNSNIIIVAENKNIGESEIIYKLIKKKFNNLEFRFNILGHIQRCGSPTCIDRILAIRLGIESIKNLINLKYNFVIGIKNNKITYIPFKKAIKNKKLVIDKI